MGGYAERTKVPADKTRREVEALLLGAGCTGVQWTVEPRTASGPGACRLRWRWDHQGSTYVARIALPLPARGAAYAAGKRTVRGVDEWLAGEERRLHRVLLLKLKADLHAVREGLLPMVEVFLPHLEVPGGRTLGEAAVPQLRALHGPEWTKLIP